MRRSQFLQAVVAALGLPAASRAATPVPQLHDLRASNGGRPFAGDGPRLTTISPRRATRRRALDPLLAQRPGARAPGGRPHGHDPGRQAARRGRVGSRADVRSRSTRGRLASAPRPSTADVPGTRRRERRRPAEDVRPAPAGRQGDGSGRSRARSPGRADEDELRAGRADRSEDRERLGLARGPGLPLRRAGAVRRARPPNERRRRDPAGARRLACASRGSVAPALPACRRVAQRSLLRPRARRRRQRRVRAVHRPSAHAWRAPGRGRPLDEHVAGVQLPRRGR